MKFCPVKRVLCKFAKIIKMESEVAVCSYPYGRSVETPLLQMSDCPRKETK